VRDRERVFRVIKDFKPDIVFHAAALKHVPYLERDWAEGVKTNVFGSVNVADAAIAAGAAAMVMISTTKPSSRFPCWAPPSGSRKCIARRSTPSSARPADASRGSTRFISVRFGNVLASNGSVVPKFKAQIEAAVR
jgi:O-antigen biosynthesis protein WbqV